MNILFSIFALGLLVFLHELGHFLAARWCGMKVHEFSVGFGPLLFGINLKGTQYSIRAIFLGGYVRIAGMHPGESDASEPNSFLGSAPWKRFVSIAAGPLANYITALFLLWLSFMAWGIAKQPTVKKVEASSIFAKAGIQPGDSFLGINGEAIHSTPSRRADTLLTELLKARQGKDFWLTIFRNGKVYRVAFPASKEEKKKSLGFDFVLEEKVTISKLESSSDEKLMNLKVGDQIVKVGNFDVHKSYAFWFFLEHAFHAETSLLIRRKNEILTLRLGEFAQKKLRDVLNLSAEERVVVKRVLPGSRAQSAGIEVNDHLLSLSFYRTNTRVSHGKSSLLEENHQTVSSKMEGSSSRPVTRRATSQGNLKTFVLKSQPYRSYSRRLRDSLRHCVNQRLSVRFVRDDKEKELIIPHQNKESDCWEGMEIEEPKFKIFVGSTKPHSTAEKIGLRSGDQILTVDGQNVQNFSQLNASIHSRAYRSIQMMILRDGKTKALFVPQASSLENARLGFHPSFDYPLARKGVFVAFRMAFDRTVEINHKIYQGLKRIFTGKDEANLTGPVGIVNLTQRAAQLGGRFFLTFVAWISVNLAIFNLLPIPALDGGRLMFLFTQQLFRLFGMKDSIGLRIENTANIVSFFVFFVILLLITFNDIYQWFSG